MRIALIGYGAMGKLVEARATAKGHAIGTVVNEYHSNLDAERLAESLRVTDVAIDFSAAETVERNVEACLAAGVPLVEGTTGWSDKFEAVERRVRDADGTFLYGANFSIGVNLYYRVVQHAAELFAGFSEYEVFIEEQHHSRKKDAPSGTARELKQIISKYTGDEIEIASTRAGNIPGTHRVGFDGSAEQILLEHSARSRECFAIGALMAAEWVEERKGFFTFADVMDDLLDRQKKRL